MTVVVLLLCLQNFWANTVHLTASLEGLLLIPQASKVWLVVTKHMSGVNIPFRSFLGSEGFSVYSWVLPSITLHLLLSHTTVWLAGCECTAATLDGSFWTLWNTIVRNVSCCKHGRLWNNCMTVLLQKAQFWRSYHNCSCALVPCRRLASTFRAFPAGLCVFHDGHESIDATAASTDRATELPV